MFFILFYQLGSAGQEWRCKGLIMPNTVYQYWIKWWHQKNSQWKCQFWCCPGKSLKPCTLINWFIHCIYGANQFFYNIPHCAASECLQEKKKMAKPDRYISNSKHQPKRISTLKHLLSMLSLRARHDTWYIATI